MMSNVHVTREVELDCSTADAWELLTDPDELSAWLGRPVDFELEVEVGERVRFLWSDDGRDPSEVEFRLEQTESGTRLTVTETSPARASVAGGIRRLPIGANWDDRFLDLELLCLTRAAARV
jgi:uncharacterized protein YndB with AHSA1/START domain